MHYIYSDNSQPVPEGVRVFELPEGGWVTMEDGKRRTVTAMKDEADGFPLAPPQDAAKFTLVDPSPAFQAQLDRIEALVKSLAE